MCRVRPLKKSHSALISFSDINDVDDFEMMQKRMAILEGIACGEKTVKEGQVLSNKSAKEQMKKWLK
jgi:hypothetical protein